MFKVSERVQIIVEVICIIILLSMCLVIYNHGRSLDCNKCLVTFKQTRMLGIALNPPKVLQYYVVDLYSNLTKLNECLIKWDRTNGFIDSSNRKEYEIIN